MAVDDTEEAVDNLQDQGRTIDTLTTIWQSLAFVDRDTDEAELEVYELINKEIRDMRDVFNAVDFGEKD